MVGLSVIMVVVATFSVVVAAVVPDTLSVVDSRFVVCVVLVPQMSRQHLICIS